MEAAKRVAKNTGILYIRMAITVFISLYSTRLILSALGVADFGLFNLVGGVISMLGFLNSSMAAATQRFMSFAHGEGDIKKIKRIFNMSSVLHWGIAIMVLLLLEVASYFCFNGTLNIAPDRIFVAKLIYQFMVISTIFTVISVPYEAVITSHENMMVYAVMGVIEAFLKLGIAIYITYSSMDHLVMYGILMAALSILLLIFKRIYCHRVYDECNLNVVKYFDKSLLQKMSRFAAWSFLGSSTSMISSYGQGVILNIFFGTLINSAQAVAMQVSGQIGTFSLTMRNALNPILMKSLGAGNINMMLKASILGTKISFFLFILFAIPVFIEMSFIFNLWLRDVPIYALIFCKLLLLRNLIEQFYTTLTSTIAASGNIVGLEICTMILNILPLFFSYFFLKQNYPVYSVYIIYLIYSILFLIIVIYFANKTSGISIWFFSFNVVFRLLILSFILFFISSRHTYFMSPSITRLFFTICLTSTSIIIFGWYIGFTNEDRTNLIKYIKNYKKL